MQAEIKQSEQRFRSYFELGLIGMAITSPEKRWIELNGAICDMFGYSRQEFARLTWTEMTHPEDLEPDLIQFNRLLIGEIDGYSMEKRFIRKDNSILYAIISANTLRKADGSVDYFIALIHDITERKQAEEALRASEIKFRTMFESSLDAIGVSIRGSHTLVNPAYLQMFGYDRAEELIGLPILNCIAPSEHKKIIEHVQARTRGEYAPSAYETRGRRKDGSEFDMDVHLSTYTLDDELYKLVILRDITTLFQVESVDNS